MFSILVRLESKDSFGFERALYLLGDITKAQKVKF